MDEAVMPFGQMNSKIDDRLRALRNG